MSENRDQNQEKLVDKILAMQLAYYGCIVSAHLAVLFLLDALNLLNGYSLFFIGMSTLAWFTNGRRILLSYLSKQERQELRQFPNLL